MQPVFLRSRLFPEILFFFLKFPLIPSNQCFVGKIIHFESPHLSFWNFLLPDTWKSLEPPTGPLHTAAPFQAPYPPSQTGASKCLQSSKPRQRANMLAGAVQPCRDHSGLASHTSCGFMGVLLVGLGTCWERFAEVQSLHNFLVPRGKYTMAGQVEGLRGTLRLPH